MSKRILNALCVMLSILVINAGGFNAFSTQEKPRSGPVIPKSTTTTGLCTTSSLFLAGILDDKAAQKEADCIVESLSKSQVTGKYAASYLEMAYLSDAAYKSGGMDFQNNWIFLESYTSQRTGLDAKVFKNKNDSTVVVAFGGTADSKDVSTDISQFVLGFKFVDDLANSRDKDDMKAKLKKYADQISPQYKDALDYVKGIQQKYNVAKVTGHSLGGGLAQYVAAKLNLTAVTFNPAGLSGAYIDLLQSCGGKKSCGKNITNIITYSQVASTEGLRGLRRRMLLGDKDQVSGLGILLGNNLKLTISDSNVTDAYELHKIGTCIHALAQLSIIIDTTAKDASQTDSSTISIGIKPDDEKSTTSVASIGYSDTVTGMEFIKVTGGCFQMGDIFGDGLTDEKPVHKVCLNGFSIGKYEVTQGQWKKIMHKNPSYTNLCNGDNCPINNISWDDANNFISRLNKLSGKKYRLPTEAEWEYTCRSRGKKEKYCGGNDVNSLAWHFIKPSRDSDRKIHPVGQKKENGLGIYDMSGNVREWVQDWCGNYSKIEQLNPVGPKSGSKRVYRGGSYYDDESGDVRATSRSCAKPDKRWQDFGFRLVFSDP